MSEAIDLLLDDARERMGKSVESTQHEFSSVRTGRASTSLLDRVVVDYYGAPTPLKQLATLGAPEARLLTVQPFDGGTVKLIEKAIVDSGLGLTPNNDGKMIRIQIPEMTEERRKEMVKVAKGIAEHGRVAIRGVRRDVMHELKKLKDDGDVGADDESRGEAELQKVTDAAIAELDQRLKSKESEILEV
jgi:ribosome recycling factor